MSSPKPRIQALARASAIIDVIAGGDMEGVTLGDVCRATDLNKTTAFNLLSSLVTLRFVDQDNATRRYRLGLRNVELGRLVQHRLHIPEIARPVLIDLCRKTNETVSLALPDHLDLLVIDSLKGTKYLQATAYTGSRSLYHCTALGKAVLAQRNETMRHTIYRMSGVAAPDKTHDHRHRHTRIPVAPGSGHKGMPSMPRKTKSESIASVRLCLTVSGEVAAAISVTGPSNRWTEDTIRHHAEDVISAANTISQALGCGDRLDYREAERR